MVQFLLDEAHTNPNVTDKQGRVPLDFANDANITILLLKHGAKTENVYKSHSKVIGKLSSERPPDKPTVNLYYRRWWSGKKHYA